MQNVQVAVQEELNHQMNHDEPQLSHPENEPNNLLDPNVAIFDEDRARLQTFREKVMAIKLESCVMCHEEWFDLGVQNGICNKCIESSKWQPINEMYPGEFPAHLPQLTQIEEMLISPVHALIQLWQI